LTRAVPGRRRYALLRASISFAALSAPAEAGRKIEPVGIDLTCGLARPSRSVYV